MELPPEASASNELQTQEPMLSKPTASAKNVRRPKKPQQYEDAHHDSVLEYLMTACSEAEALLLRISLSSAGAAGCCTERLMLSTSCEMVAPILSSARVPAKMPSD